MAPFSPLHDPERREEKNLIHLKCAAAGPRSERASAQRGPIKGAPRKINHSAITGNMDTSGSLRGSHLSRTCRRLVVSSKHCLHLNLCFEHETQKWRSSSFHYYCCCCWAEGFSSNSDFSRNIQRQKPPSHSHNAAKSTNNSITRNIHRIWQ